MSSMIIGFARRLKMLQSITQQAAKKTTSRITTIAMVTFCFMEASGASVCGAVLDGEYVEIDIGCARALSD